MEKQHTNIEKQLSRQESEEDYFTSKKLPSRRILWIGLISFLATALLAIVVHSLMGRGLDLSRSISRYVGFEIWSAVIFTVGNCIVVASVSVFLWRIGRLWRMPRLYYYLVFVMSVALLWLSVCPVGYCDVDGRVSLVSKMHQIASRTMFMMMLLTAVLIAGNPYASRKTHIASALYAVYGAICVMGYLTEGVWFTPALLIIESVYVAGFIVMLMFCDNRSTEMVDD